MKLRGTGASHLRSDSRRFNRLDAAWLAIWLIFLAGLAVLLHNSNGISN